MKNLYYFLFLLPFIAFPDNSRGPVLHFDNAFEKKVFEKVISDPFYKDYLTCLLVSEGVDDSSEISVFKRQVELFVKGLDQEIDRSDDLIDQSEDIYDFLYDHLFRKEADDAQLQHIFDHKTFNPVVAGTFYLIICRHYNLPVESVVNEMFQYVLFVENKDTVRIFFDNSGEGFDTTYDDLFSQDTDDFEMALAKYLYDEADNNTSKAGIRYEMAFNYYNRGVLLFDKNEFKKALQILEKAEILYPDDEIIHDSYLESLVNLNLISNDYAQFIPFLKNAFWIVNSGNTDLNIILPLINQAIFYYTVEQYDFESALKFIDLVRIHYNDDIIIVSVNKLEHAIVIENINTLLKRGFWKEAYIKSKNLYYVNKDIPVYKEIFIETGMVIIRRGFYKPVIPDEIYGIIDTLYLVAPDYPAVEEIYIQSKLHPIIKDPDVINKNTTNAYRMIMKVYQQFPENDSVRQVVARVYYQLGMNKVGENKLNEAFKIMKEGLNYAPGNELLESGLDSILHQYE